MGRKLDALLGRNFKTTKFKTLTKLAISRSTILKNQRQARCQQAKSDVLELLKLGHNERALLRVELVIKDQNMVDAFDMIEDYCQLLSERVVLLQNNKECPEELQEAISSLIFASSRCGVFPELQGIRGIIASRFGKEFADRAIELRNNCGVSAKIIQKLSARQPSMESKLNALKQIASNNGIILRLEEETPVVAEEKQAVTQNEKQQQLESDVKSTNLSDSNGIPQENPRVALREEINIDKTLSESLKVRKKYKDVASAALDAFASAAYAAAAARAAVQLSKSESHDDNDQNHSNGCFAALEEDDRLIFDRIYRKHIVSSESEGEQEMEKPEIEMRHEVLISSSNSDKNGNDLLKITSGSSVDYNAKPVIPAKNHRQLIGKYPVVPDRDGLDQEEEGFNSRLPFHSPKWGSEKSNEDEVNLTEDKDKPEADGGKKVNLQHLRLDSKPVLVRTRKVGGK